MITSTDYSLALYRVLPVSSDNMGTNLASDTPYMFLFQNTQCPKITPVLRLSYTFIAAMT